MGLLEVEVDEVAKVVAVAVNAEAVAVAGEAVDAASEAAAGAAAPYIPKSTNPNPADFLSILLRSKMPNKNSNPIRFSSEIQLCLDINCDTLLGVAPRMAFFNWWLILAGAAVSVVATVLVARSVGRVRVVSVVVASVAAAAAVEVRCVVFFSFSFVAATAPPYQSENNTICPTTSKARQHR